MNLEVARIRLLCLATVLLGTVAIPGWAEDNHILPLPSGQEIEIQRFAGNGKALILWLPSERGIGQAQAQHAKTLAQMGYEVWLADLHDAYFVERNRRSIARFPLNDVVDIIQAATDAAEAGVFLLSSSRGAQLSLVAAREWQLRNPGQTGLRGAFFAHAYLYEARPEVGESGNYLPIARATNLPLFLIDAQYSTRSSRIDELAAELGKGGSRVFTQVMKNVHGGFFARDESDLSESDKVARRDYARSIDRGIGILGKTAAPSNAVATAANTRRLSLVPTHRSKLTAIDKPMPAPALRLNNYDGDRYSIEQRDGQVVLVNFWASWCKPCVEEIPSLHRLKSKIENPAFEIVTVNVGENHARIAEFLQKVPVELPLLLDLDSEAAKQWKIYVYPSSYLVDHRGQIRYAYLGALEWDSPENITIIQSLLKQR